MPAYRSEAEAEVRDAVVARLRAIRPDARIMHEVNCSLFGPNRIDVIAVSPQEIISVEVKSKKDKLDRLPAQIASMRRMSHHVIAALHQKFMVERETNQWRATFERDGKYWFHDKPEEASGAIVWQFPEPDHDMDRWRDPGLTLQRANIECLDMLWAEEMREFCHLVGVEARARDSRTRLLPLIRWRCTGEQITKGVCEILRRRECVEADPPVERSAA